MPGLELAIKISQMLRLLRELLLVRGISDTGMPAVGGDVVAMGFDIATVRGRCLGFGHSVLKIGV